MKESSFSRILCVVITILYSLKQKLLSLVKALSSWSISSFSHISSASSSDPLSHFYSLGCELEKRSKLPEHIAFILLERRISVQDLARLIQWCSTVGVPNISIYNGSENLPLHWKELSLILNSFPYWPSLKSRPIYEVYHEDQVSPKNISESSRVTRVYLLTTRHGRNSLVNVAKSLCRTIPSSGYTVEMIDAELRKQLPIPDPELMLKFGSADVTLGYPPWSLRLTEMLRLPSHIQIQPGRVLAALRAYGRCEQRFGK